MNRSCCQKTCQILKSDLKVDVGKRAIVISAGRPENFRVVLNHVLTVKKKLLLKGIKCIKALD